MLLILILLILILYKTSAEYENITEQSCSKSYHLSLFFSGLKQIPFSEEREIYDLPGDAGKSVHAKITTVFIHYSGQSKVLNLPSKSHLATVRIEGLSKYLRWLVYWAFELLSRMTTNLYSIHLIQP